MGFCLLFMLWLLWDYLEKRRDHELLPRENPTIFTKITVLLNFLISITYLGFCLHEFRKLGAVSTESACSTMAWCCACVMAVYSASSVHKRWPLVLSLWWIYFTNLDLLVLFFFFKKSESIQVPNFLPRANFTTFTSLPLSLLLLGFNAVTNKSEKTTDRTHPLLDDHLENDVGRNADPYSGAGILSQLTFRWQNPLFEKGNHEKLQKEDIPDMPQSETAEEASSLLEESLRKQKGNITSLPKAILNAIRGPLVTNAVFAGTYLF